MPTPRAVRVLAPLILAVATALVGCGGASSRPAGTAPGPTAAAPGPTGTAPSARVPASGAHGGGSPARTGGRAASALRRATLVLDWYPNGDHAGIYSAQARGYTRAAGLALTVQVPANPSAALQEVAAGRAQFAVNYEPGVLLARAQHIPVVAVAAMVQRPLDSIISLKSAGITTPADLRGKRIGTDGLPQTIALLNTVLRHAGVQPDQVTEVDVSEGNVPALLAHKVDAIIGAYWNWEAVEIQLAGQPVNVLRLNREGVPNYDELVFVTSDRVLQQQPALVRAFLQAEMRGEAFAAHHPRQATQYLLAASKDLKANLVTRSLQLLQPVWQDGAPRLGYMNPKQWDAFEQWMVQQKVLAHPVQVSQAMTNAYLPAAGSSGA